MSTNRKVVITGLGLATPAGYTLEENYKAWREGIPNFTEITSFNIEGTSVKYAGHCARPNAKLLPDRKVQKILRRKDVISLLTTIETVKHAGIEKGDVDPERFGMYVGASATQIGDLTPYFHLVAECADLDAGTFDSAKFGRDLLDLVNPLVVLQTLMNNGLCFGTMTLDIRGVNSNFMDFNVAGLRAVGEGYRSVATARADVVVAGGISGPIEPFQLAEGVRSGYLAKTSDYNEPPTDVLKPYDKNRTGSILSEGSAYVILEEEERAVKRGAKIYGRVDGYGLSNDGHFNFMNETDSPGLKRSMQLALDEANLTKADGVGMIVGHGSGAIAADRAEAKAYLDFWEDMSEDIPIVSPKAVLGDLCEAGGVAGLILALDSLSTKKVPPTWNYTAGDENSSKLAISSSEQQTKGKTALITSRSFLGLSGSLLVSQV